MMENTVLTKYIILTTCGTFKTFCSPTIRFVDTFCKCSCVFFLQILQQILINIQKFGNIYKCCLDNRSEIKKINVLVKSQFERSQFIFGQLVIQNRDHMVLASDSSSWLEIVKQYFLLYFILYFDKYNDNWAHSPTRSITTPFWWFDVCETIQRWWKRVQGCVDSSEIAVCINWAIAVTHLVSWSFKIETTWCWQVIVHHDGKYSVNKIHYFNHLRDI